MAIKEAQELTNLATFKDVYFYYSNLSIPVLTKAAKDKGIKPNPDDPKANGEYVAKIVVTFDQFRKMKKQFPRVSNFPKAKEYTISEFRDVFHADGGMPDFGDATELVMIKFAQKSRSAAGRDAFAPKVIGIKGKVQDHKGLTITQDTLLGNGTKGHLQVRLVEFSDFDPYLYPNAICITDLVEYKSAGGGGTEVDYDDFGIEELDEADLDKISVSEELTDDDDDNDMF